MVPVFFYCFTVARNNTKQHAKTAVYLIFLIWLYSTLWNYKEGTNGANVNIWFYCDTTNQLDPTFKSSGRMVMIRCKSNWKLNIQNSVYPNSKTTFCKGFDNKISTYSIPLQIRNFLLFTLQITLFYSKFKITRSFIQPGFIFN